MTGGTVYIAAIGVVVMLGGTGPGNTMALSTCRFWVAMTGCTIIVQSAYVGVMGSTSKINGAVAGGALSVWFNDGLSTGDALGMTGSTVIYFAIVFAVDV